MTNRTGLLLLAAALLTSACGRGDEPAPAAEETMPGMEGMQGMEGMEGMQGMGGMASTGMMTQMESHMAGMEGVRGDSLRAMVPMHRQMTANLIAEMNREMREMGMAADAGWNATVDSLRQDLRTLPEMGADELETAMPEHRARMRRLMEQHRAMMADM